MRWSATWLFGVALTGLACGCRSCDLVESELRAREDQLREVRAELERSQFYSQALQHELHALRGEPAAPGAAPAAGQAYPVRTLTLGRQTGGHATGRCAG